jgi:hypothetical protein
MLIDVRGLSAVNDTILYQVPTDVWRDIWWQMKAPMVDRLKHRITDHICEQAIEEFNY